MENFTFLLGITQNENHRESGVLGLKIPEFNWRINNISFIKQLKERDLIHKYNFYIQYNDNDDNGNLVIGSLPHENDPKKFNKDKYDEFYATIVMSSLGLRVKKAFYGDEVIDYGFNVELAVEDNFIKGNSKAGITTGFFVFVQDGKKRHISKINIKIYYGILHF
jgi:hypothetical protein